MKSCTNGPDLIEDEKRRKRNRDSQRHFRERRSRHIKELEERIATFSRSESERNARLIAENSDLRISLSRAREHSLRLKSVLNELLKSVDEQPGSLNPPPQTNAPSDAINGDCDASFTSDPNWPVSESHVLLFLDESGKSPRIDMLMVEQIPESEYLYASQANWAELGIEHSLPDVQSENDKDAASNGNPTLLDVGQPAASQAPSMDFFGAHASILCAAPSILTTKTSTGVFGDSVLRVTFDPQDSRLLQSLFVLLNQEFLSKALEPMSRRIDGMMVLMEDYLKLTGGISDEKIVSQASLAAMMAFAKHASPLPAVMWFCSACYSLVETLIRWQLKRAFQTFQALPLHYEQSDLSLSTPHPCVIDWFAFGGLRDQIIKHFNDCTKIDQIFIEIMEHTVVEVADISSVLASVPAGPGFLGVWNLFNAMTGGASKSNLQATCTVNTLELHDKSLPGLYQMHQMSSPDTATISRHTSQGKGCWTPIPLPTLLRSPELSRQLYHYLELYNSHKCWKYDPVFYNKYPQLRWEGYEDTLAQGNSYRVSSSWIMSTRTTAPHSSRVPIS